MTLTLLTHFLDSSADSVRGHDPAGQPAESLLSDCPKNGGNFTESLEHEATACLERPFVKYIETNLPQKARDHFYGLREGKSDLVGIAIFDHLETELDKERPLIELMWSKREIENYFCTEDVLLAYAHYNLPNDLFGAAEADRRMDSMRAAIDDVTQALSIYEKSPWSPDIKATDDVLDPIFRIYFQKLGLPLQLRKAAYHELAGLMPAENLDPEIIGKLDQLVQVAKTARPRL
jgi:hypothetical protein